ncbi:MAG TPA: TonB family protein [Puia sp.]|jgi:TonB family protein|nr:TonB family protein [Puia sp.]
MHKPIFATLTCIAFLRLTAAAQDTTWFNSSWSKTTSDKAAYFNVKQKTDSGWLYMAYYHPGAKLQTKALYADDSFHVFNGEYRAYNDKGILIHLLNYTNGKRNGPEVMYHDNGQELEKGLNKGDHHDGPWTGYYPSGKLAGTATYVEGKETDVRLYNEDGSPKSEKVFEREAQYPGGPREWLQYMNKNLRYPDYAVKHDIQGIVIVQFKTSKTGKVLDISIIRSVEKHVDAEAFRMIRETPDWEPSLAAGQPVESWHKQPIVFKM